MTLCTLGTGITSDVQRLELFNEHDHPVRRTGCNWGSYCTRALACFHPHTCMIYSDSLLSLSANLRMEVPTSFMDEKASQDKGHHLNLTAMACMHCCITDDEDVHARVVWSCLLQRAGHRGLLYRPVSHRGVLITAPLGSIRAT